MLGAILRFDVKPEQDMLTIPLAGPPRPFAPFFVGRGESVFRAEDVREVTTLDRPAHQ